MPGRIGLFACLMALSLVSTRSDGASMAQVVIWLPTGFAVAGAYLLGWRGIATVFLLTLADRLLLGTTNLYAAGAAIGSSAEAWLGAWLLRRARITSTFAHLRDVLAVFAVAAIAPVASIVSAALTRLAHGTFDVSSLVGGAVGWWHMNALAILVVLPLALTWRRPPRRRDGTATYTRTIAWCAVTSAITAVIVWLLQPSVQSIVLLGLVPMASFTAAIHAGSRAATASAFAGSLLVSLPAVWGHGPFMAIALVERHQVAQMVLLAIAAPTPILVALLAERAARNAYWLRSEGASDALLRLLPDASYRIDRHDLVRNAIVPDDLGLPGPDEVIGRKLADVVPAELHETLDAMIREARAVGPPEPFEYVWATGRERQDCEVRIVPLPNSELLVVWRDIGNRKRAERQLRFQADVLERIAGGQQLSTVLTAITEGLEVLIPDGKVAVLLRRGDELRVAATLGMPPGFVDLVDGLPVAPDAGSCGAATFRNETVISEDTLNDPNMTPWRDRLRELGLRACWSVPIRGPHGAAIGTVSVQHGAPRAPTDAEIAAVERAATLTGLALERERREGLLSSIQNNTHDGLYRVEPGRDFVYVNHALARQFGYRNADHMLQDWRSEADGPHRASLEWLVASEQDHSGHKVELHRRDGSSFWALTSSLRVAAADARDDVRDGSITDISNLIELETQLRQAQKMEAVGQLAGGVAHDFNNLLTAISGFAEAIRMSLPEDTAPRGDAEQILAAATRASTLTRQLLALGRRQVLRPERIELNEVIDNLATMLRRVIKPSIELRLAPDPAPVHALVDENQFEQVVLNLVINARDAIAEGGVVTLRTATRRVGWDQAVPGLDAGTYALVQVGDDGAGMPAEVRARAFEPFFTTKGPGRGTGLGLSTVYGIVKQSGGLVVIDSEVGSGTTISVFLPVAAGDEIAAPPTAADYVIPRRTTVLIADDEEAVLTTAAKAIEAHGHTVLKARDGREALELWKQHREHIGLVLTDVVMPQMGGRELAAELRKLSPTARMIFMSGYSRELAELATDASEPGSFVDKPFSPSKLADQVELVLAAPPRGT